MPLDGKNYTDDLTDTEKAARDDLFLWLDRFPARVPALLKAVREGRMNGSTYKGRCRCVIGTLGTESATSAEAVGIAYRASGMDRTPIEWFVNVARPGDTPANSLVMARLEEWIMQWQAA